jgi:hypothetical protein
VLVNPLREPLPPQDDDTEEDEQPAAAAAAVVQQQQQQQQQQDAIIDITALAGLTALQLLQVDLRPLPQQQDLDLNPMPYPMPLQLRFSAAAVQQLAAVWSRLVTLDLSGFGSQLLPADAVAGFSAFRSLKHLSIMSAEGVLTHGVQDQQQQQQGAGAQAGSSRKVGWWQLPQGLSSLCISHFDLTSSYDNSSSSSSLEQACCSSSSCCCMAALPQDLQQQQGQQQQQRQNSPTGFGSRVQQFISPNSSPLKPFAKGRRSQPNQQQQQLGSNAGSEQLGRQGLGDSSSPTNSSSSSAGVSSSRAVAGAEVTAAVVAAAIADGSSTGGSSSSSSSSSSRAAAGAVEGLQQLSGQPVEVCSCVARCV